MSVPRVGMSPTQSDADQMKAGRVAEPSANRNQDDMEVGTSEDSQSGRSSQSSFVDNKLVSRLHGDEAQGESSCDSTDSKPDGSDPIDSISGMLGEIFRKVKTKFKDGNKDDDQKRDSDTSENNQTDQPVKRKRGRPPKKRGGQKNNKEDDNNSDNDTNDSVQTRRRSSRLKTLEQNSEGADGEKKKEKRGRKPKVKQELEQEVPIIEASGESPSALPLRPTAADFAVPR